MLHYVFFISIRSRRRVGRNHLAVQLAWLSVCGWIELNGAANARLQLLIDAVREYLKQMEMKKT